MATDLIFQPDKKDITLIPDLILNPIVSKIYTNGAQYGFTFSDAHIIFKHNDVPMALITMSLTSLKTLHEQVGKLLETYKSTTGQDVVSIEEIATIFNQKSNSHV